MTRTGPFPGPRRSSYGEFRMHAEEQLADLPEALPLRRVSPWWLVLALLEAVLVIVLGLGLCILGLAVVRQRTVPVTGPVVATPVPRGAFVPGVAAFPALPADEEEPADAQNLPYPTKADLQQSALPRPDAAEPVNPLRQRFLDRGIEIWKLPRPYFPNHVSISPDGESLAFPA